MTGGLTSIISRAMGNAVDLESSRPEQQRAVGRSLLRQSEDEEGLHKTAAKHAKRILLAFSFGAV